MSKASTDDDGRAIIVRTLIDLADDHARAGEIAYQRGDTREGRTYVEIAASLRESASVLELRRGLVAAYELAIETSSAPSLHVVKGGAA